MDYKIGKVIKKVILAFVITVGLFSAVVAFNDFGGTLKVLQSADPKWLVAGLAVLGGYMVFNIWSFYILMHDRCKLAAKDIFLVAATEPFFNGITPFSSGGQPFQAYALYRMGVPLKDSTTALMMNFLIYMVPTNIFALASLAFFHNFMSTVPGLVTVAVIGFAINFAVVVMFLSVAFSKQFRVTVKGGVVWLSKFKLFKKLLKNRTETIDTFFENVQDGCSELIKKPKIFLFSLAVKVVSLVLYYSIPFVFIKALHVNIAFGDILYIMLGTSFAITMVVWVPTPGSAGGIELAFKSIFATVAGVTGAVAMGGMVLWRLYTYYLLIFIGLICYLVFEVKIDKVKKRDNETQ